MDSSSETKTCLRRGSVWLPTSERGLVRASRRIASRIPLATEHRRSGGVPERPSYEKACWGGLIHEYRWAA